MLQETKDKMNSPGTVIDLYANTLINMRDKKMQENEARDVYSVRIHEQKTD